MEEECLNAAAVKGAEWAYENEWRYIELSSAGSFLEFDETFVSWIILGANVSKETKLEVGRLLRVREAKAMKSLKACQVFLDNKAKKLAFKAASLH